MELEIFKNVYYSNTVIDWIISFVIIVLALVLGKLSYWLFKNFSKNVAQKSKTNLDNLIVDMVEEPIVFCITTLGIWFGISRLTLNTTLENWINLGVHFLITVAITWLLVRLVDALFNHYLVPLTEKSETDLDDLLLPILRKGTKFAVWSFGIIIALNNAGQDVGALIAGLGIGGLALAMAAKDTVANVFGGFTIFTDQPFTLKDRIKVGGTDGVVEEIGIRSTRIRTLAGTLVTIPNSKFADSEVENISAEPARKIITNLGLTYDTTPQQMQRAMDILREIVQADGGLEEKCLISFNGYGDFAMNIILIYYIKKNSDIFDSQTAVNLKILERFNEEALEFAFPTQTIYTKPTL